MSVVSIKGIRDGLLVTVDDSASWAEVERALLGTIEARGDFFRGVQIALQVGDRILDREDIRKLSAKLAEHDIRLAAILGRSAETMRSARRLEIDTELPEGAEASDASYEVDLPPIDTQEHGDSAVLVRATLRSGRMVRHAGHVVVIGDVNPGAEIVAGGDVVVWGRLRGTVHAGANGDVNAIVCALDMRPMQLRIAHYVAIASDDGKPRPRPEVARVQNGQIVAEEWGA